MSWNITDKNDPFFVSPIFSERWNKLALKQLETIRDNFSSKIDGLPKDSFSMREQMLDTLRQLNFYITQRQARDEQS